MKGVAKKKRSGVPGYLTRWNPPRMPESGQGRLGRLKPAGFTPK